MAMRQRSAAGRIELGFDSALGSGCGGTPVSADDRDLGAGRFGGGGMQGFLEDLSDVLPGVEPLMSGNSAGTKTLVAALLLLGGKLLDGK
ncbi:MAG: hypothetical protein AB8H80_12630 [Planctomycetota bacterium]